MIPTSATSQLIPTLFLASVAVSSLVQDSLKRAIKSNLQRLQLDEKSAPSSSDFEELISHRDDSWIDISDQQWSDDKKAVKQFSWLNPHIAKAIWRKRDICFLNKSATDEIQVSRQVLSNPTKFKWEIPIAHLIKRDPDYQSWGDSSLSSAGGFSIDLDYWWEVDWPEEVRKRTLKFKDTPENKRYTGKDGFLKKKLIDINMLEHATIIINFACATFAYLLLNEATRPKQPVLLNWADNKSAKSWTKKAARHSIGSKALSRILARLMLHSLLGINCDFIPTEENIIADGISRLKSKNFFDINRLMQEFPQLMHCRRFHISPEFLSEVCSALCSGNAKAVTEMLEFEQLILKKSISVTG